MSIDLTSNSTDLHRSTITLEYAAGSHSQDFLQRKWLLVLSLPVLAVPFLNFTYTVSPLDAVRSIREYWPLSLLGIEFFFGPITLAWRLGLLIYSAPPTAIVRAIAVLAVLAWLPFIATCVIIAINFVSVWGSTSLWEFFVDGWPAEIMAAILIIGLLTTTLQFSKRNKINALTTALTAPYLGICTLCLIGFRSDSKIGYWMTSVVVTVWGAEFIWDAIRPIANRFRRARRL